MKMPALLHGTESDVRKRCRAVEKTIAGGASLGDALAGANEIDTREVDGLIIMQPRKSPLAGQRHLFPCMLPDRIADGVIEDRIDRKRERSLFEELIARPYGVLGLLSMPVGNRWTVRHLAWIRDLVNAVARDWELFLGEGFRYSKNSPEGKKLYELTTFLGPALHYCGVPESALRARLFTEGLKPLLHYLQ